jgi:tetratricopeptide (TPR) repeat protein
VPRALVIDQFEELFTVFPEHWTRRARFVEQLTEALDGDPLLRVLLAIREDYLAQLGSLVKSSAERSTAQFRLERLGPEAALVAVQKPLEGRTRSYAKGVPKKLVDDLLKFRVDTGRGESVEVTGEFVEPVQLQVVCQSLWSQLPPDVTEITEDHMRAFGDVNQALSRFYAEAAKAAADDAHISEKEVRQWIEDHFITSAGTRGFVYRGGSVSAGMANEVIDVLEDKHLIRAEWRAGARWYELTHDRFITPIRVSNREYFESLLAARSEVDERAVRAYESMQTGHAHLVAGEYALALDASEQALAIYEQLDDPWGAADALETIAFARYALGELEPALLYFRRALELLAALDDPSGHSTTRAWQAAVLQNVGAVQLQLGDSKQGLDAYQRALRLYRETGDAAAMATVLAVIADLHRAGNAPEAALKAYEEAMAQYVSVRDTESQQQMLLEIGDLYHELEEYGKAVECADEALELDAASVRALYQRAAAHWYEGDYSAAVDDFTEVLELEPGWDLAYSGRGQALAEAGEFEPAVADLDLAIELAGSDVASRAYAHSGRGLAYGGLGRFRQALKEFEVSLKAQPGNAWAYFNRAVTYERMGKAAEAIADFQQALESSEPPLNRIKRDHALAKVSKA